MYTEPVLELDQQLLLKYRAECIEKQEADRLRLQKLFNYPTTDSFLKALRSNASLAEMLEFLGATVPMKESKAKKEQVERAIAAKNLLIEKVGSGVALSKKEQKALGELDLVIDTKGQIPAFAKTDIGFIELMESEDEDIALLCQLRMENNSSIALSRADTFLDIASRGKFLSIPLMAWGAQTGRYTGSLGSKDKSDRTNLQNLPKHDSNKTLREAIKAPEGHLLVAADSKQIEARVGAWLAGQEDLVNAFVRGEDIYILFASMIYGIPPEVLKEGIKNKDPRAKFQRGVGKVVILSSQYGIGAPTLANFLTREGLRLGNDPEEHKKYTADILRLYKKQYHYITEFKYYCGKILTFLCNARDGEGVFDTAHCRLRYRKEGLDATIFLPSGFPLVYPGIRWADGSQIVYDQFSYGKNRVRKIYGGQLFNNLVQSLSFNALWLQGILLNTRYKVVSNIHDSWIAVCKEEEVEAAKVWAEACLTTAPSWGKGIPFGVEVAVSKTYGIA
jgi:hypothetical protein